MTGTSHPQGRRPGPRVGLRVRGVEVDGVDGSAPGSTKRSRCSAAAASTTSAIPYVYLDATYIKARINHRIVSRAVVVATGVTVNGDREVLGVDVGDSEDEVFWTAFLRGLKDRGLSGVRLVISDAHAGLKASIATGARRRQLAALQGPPDAQHPRHRRLRRPRTWSPRPCARSSPSPHAEAVPDPAARGRADPRRPVPEGRRASSTAPRPTCSRTPRSPGRHWRKIASTNPLERINKEIKRRSNVVGIFPDDASVIRLVGAVLLDQHDDWAIAERRYLERGIHGPHRHRPRGDDHHQHHRTPSRLTSSDEDQGSQTYFHHSTGHGPPCVVAMA